QGDRTGAAALDRGTGGVGGAGAVGHDGVDRPAARPAARLPGHAGAVYLPPGVPAAGPEPGEEARRAPGPAAAAAPAGEALRRGGRTSPERQRRARPGPSLALRAGRLVQ